MHPGSEFEPFDGEPMVEDYGDDDSDSDDLSTPEHSRVVPPTMSELVS